MNYLMFFYFVIECILSVDILQPRVFPSVVTKYNGTFPAEI